MLARDGDEAGVVVALERCAASVAPCGSKKRVPQQALRDAAPGKHQLTSSHSEMPSSVNQPVNAGQSHFRTMSGSM